MRSRMILALLLLTAAAIPAFPKDVYLSVGGSINNFRTDARILNPSATKDIVVQAWMLPIGNKDNSGVQPISITVPKRRMMLLDDVISSLFNATGLGAIRLSSSDDFVATQRIYATTSAGTLGQALAALEPSQAKAHGAIVQLKSSSSFRTNLGAVNPNPVPATVTWYLYDRNSGFVASGSPIVMPPYAVIGPTNLAGNFFFNAGAADVSDAWVSYVSDQPIFAYGSVIDNSTTDPAYIPAQEDTGTNPAPQPPPPTAKTMAIHAHSWAYDVSAVDINVGDVVTVQLTASDTTHGFTLMGPDGGVLVPATDIAPGKAAIVVTFTASKPGNYNFFCTHFCGQGHGEMNGSFSVKSAAAGSVAAGQ